MSSTSPTTEAPKAVEPIDEKTKPDPTTTDPNPSTSPPTALIEHPKPISSPPEPTPSEPASPWINVQAPPVDKNDSTTPITQLHDLLPRLINESSHSEMWGIELNTKTLDHIPTQIVLEKFLRANNQDVEKARTQLLAALKWRAKMKPLQLVEREFDGNKFGGLGFVTVYEVDGEGEAGGVGKEVVSWNIYGGVKDIKKTFGDVEE
jgi:hypothetical protein